MRVLATHELGNLGRKPANEMTVSPDVVLQTRVQGKEVNLNKSSSNNHFH